MTVCTEKRLFSSLSKDGTESNLGALANLPFKPYDHPDQPNQHSVIARLDPKETNRELILTMIFAGENTGSAAVVADNGKGTVTTNIMKTVDIALPVFAKKE